MRFLGAALIILGLVALDRAYFDGQNADVLISLARQGARAINYWAEDLVRFQRR